KLFQARGAVASHARGSLADRLLCFNDMRRDDTRRRREVRDSDEYDEAHDRSERGGRERADDSWWMRVSRASDRPGGDGADLRAGREPVDDGRDSATDDGGDARRVSQRRLRAARRRHAWKPVLLGLGAGGRPVAAAPGASAAAAGALSLLTGGGSGGAPMVCSSPMDVLKGAFRCP